VQRAQTRYYAVYCGRGRSALRGTGDEIAGGTGALTSAAVTD